MLEKENEQKKDWVAGFFDAEGVIHVHIRHGKKYTNNHYFNLVLNMGQFTSNFVSGLFDGDGEIALVVNESERMDIGYRLKARNRIGLTGHGSLDCMILLKDFCEEIDVKANIREKKATKDNWADGYSLSISEFKSVKKFINTIKEDLVIKQKQADIMANQIIPMMEKGMHLDKRGVLEIMAWVDVLNEMKGGNRGRYNLEYFENEWDIKLPEEKKPEVKNSEISVYKEEDMGSIFDY